MSAPIQNRVIEVASTQADVCFNVIKATIIENSSRQTFAFL